MSYGSPDNLLEWFVRIVNDYELEIGMTLLIGGSMVTGQLISGRKYLKRIGDQVNAAMGVQAETPLFQDWIDRYYGEPRSDGGDESDQEREPIITTYVHMAGVRIRQGSQEILSSAAGTLWRGRLSCVDGFILGELSTG